MQKPSATLWGDSALESGGAMLQYSQFTLNQAAWETQDEKTLHKVAVLVSESSKHVWEDSGHEHLTFLHNPHNYIYTLCTTRKNRHSLQGLSIQPHYIISLLLFCPYWSCTIICFINRFTMQELVQLTWVFSKLFDAMCIIFNACPRKSAVAKFRLITGHDCLRRHLHKIGVFTSANCVLCSKEEEMDMLY